LKWGASVYFEAWSLDFAAGELRPMSTNGNEGAKRQPFIGLF
jgi:hypothetical protein